MSKFDLGGQVAGLSRKDAISAQASNAITDSGYLGGNSWIKSQLDAHKALFRGDPNGVQGIELVDFNSAKETMLIPDGAFDFFDLTYDLSQKNVQEALISFTGGIVGGFPAAIPAGSNMQCSWAVPQFHGTKGSVGQACAPFNGEQMGFGNLFNGANNGAGSWIVTEDYRDCGAAGIPEGGGSTGGATNLGYKISGQNPPTDDTGKIYALPGKEDYDAAFPKYSDATDASAGLRYMIGIYGGDKSALSVDADDKYVVKSASLKTLKSGVSQLVLHCRKAAATTGVTINASGGCKNIVLLKLNY